jgi:CheY-like chemotaxis protein
MPGIDGIETLRRLKAAPRLSAIPVLMITGKSEANAVLASMKAAPSTSS